MSDDIVERLLNHAKYSREWGDELSDPAAAEIVRLRAENERLVAILDERVPNWRFYR